jgi:enterochelin esterase-like enzyme
VAGAGLPVGAPPLAGASAPAALRPFPPGEAPFAADGRRELARDALTYFVRQHGLFPGRGVYILPAAAWLAEVDAMAPGEPDGGTWTLHVPASVPLYLLAHADPAGSLDPAGTTITLDGVPLTDVAAYVHEGVPALAAGRMRDFAVLDLVLAPPAPGRHRLEVATVVAGLGGEAPPSGADSAPLEPGAPWLSRLTYDLIVSPVDALGPLLLSDGGGAIFAIQGPERRRVPDESTWRVLGYEPAAIITAGPAVLAVLPEGEPLPALRSGMTLRQADDRAVYQLEGGRRHRAVAVAEMAGEATVVDWPVLQTIPPALAEGMVVRSEGPAVYLVDGGSLRQAPDWEWLQQRGYGSAAAVYVPERLLAGLPRNSPQWAMPGGRWQDRTFFSDSLGRTMPYRIYLPPSYPGEGATGPATGPTTAGGYPVLYLLHGMGGRYDEWSGYGVELVANQLLVEGALPEMIIVLPQGGLGYWMNQEGREGARWGDYIARDLVAHVDATYATIPWREGRAIGGLSMGGHGALQLALGYPEVFGVAGAHSPSLRGPDDAPAYFGDEASFAQRDPPALVRAAELARPPQIWIDFGEGDPWLPAAGRLRRALEERGWAYHWQTFAGEHDGWYWGDHLWDYLLFYGQALGRGLAGDPSAQ